MGQSLPSQFGRYRIIRQLGKGGMGAVYLAHDPQLDRQVALKVPHLGADSLHIRDRFYREARAAATIEHSNICPVHEVGDVNGVPYLTMAYIEGRPLSALIHRDRLLPQRQVAAFVQKLALALQEAHAKGVVHRDLKPANIMINQRNEPVIMDFGLARRAVPGDARLTASGALLGTPAYMSPEQVNGDLEAMGPASDIYSLGVILYELLTGRPPFQGPVAAILGQILKTQPEPPSKHRPELDSSLEAICVKAMAKKPAERYASMKELASALAEYLQHAPRSGQKDGRNTLEQLFGELAGERLVSVLHRPDQRTKDWLRRVPRWAWVAGITVPTVLLAVVVMAQVLGGRDSPKNTDKVRNERKPAPTADRAKTEQPPPARFFVPETGWVDVLTFVNPTTHAFEGHWTRDGKELTGTGVPDLASIVIPVVPRGSYDLEIRFTRRAGDWDVVVMLPVGPRCCWVLLSAWHGELHGLSGIPGPDLRGNPVTKYPGILNNSQRYLLNASVRVEGKEASVAVSLDGVPLLTWKGLQESLAERRGWTGSNWDSAACRCFGVGGKEVAVTFHSVRLRMITGRALRLDRFTRGQPLDLVAEEIITNSIGMKLAPIPAGEFMMGASPGDPHVLPPENPSHLVRIPTPFYMAIHETTQEQYQRVMSTNPSAFSNLGAEKGKVAGMDTKGFPVDTVSWTDAVEFCRKLSAFPEERRAGRTYRLPTEAEWEYACRAGTNTLFHFGNELTTRLANIEGKFASGDSPEWPTLHRTTRVGSYPANAFGLHDMHGNVWEWCNDWYSPAYYANSVGADPTGPASGEGRVCRGGSFQKLPAPCLEWRSSNRGAMFPNEKHYVYGFRVVCLLSKPEGITNSIGMKLARVSAGEFMMGAGNDEPGAQPSEKPQHRVRITKAFYMGINEVTQEQYQKVMGKNPSWFSENGGGKDKLKQDSIADTRGFPVETVSWDDAVEFCRRMSALPEEQKAGRKYRLPTEAEWEYACRAGTTTVFHFGNSLSSRQANVNGNHPFADTEKGPYLERPTIVGSYSPNAFGLYDMHGNVWEWCADWYSQSYYENSQELDPAGPVSGKARVGRGLSWDNWAQHCRSACRGVGPAKPANSVGFRVACAVKENP